MIPAPSGQGQESGGKRATDSSISSKITLKQTRLAATGSKRIQSLQSGQTSIRREAFTRERVLVGWLVNIPATCSVSQRRICSDNCTCCHTEMEVADQTNCSLKLPHCTDTGPASPSADPGMPAAWQGSRRSNNSTLK